MRKFVKYYTTFVCIYIVICAFALFSFGYVNDYGKGRYYEQIYYLDSCDYDAFLNKYRELYLSRSIDSLDFFMYRSYKRKTGGYKIEICKYVERQYVDRQDSASVCNYYLSSIDGWVHFVIEKSNPLKLDLQAYCPSIEKREEKQWKYRWVYGINSRFLPYSDNEEILDGFEQSFLVKFGSYRRDHLQEWETKYRSFLEKVFIGDGLNLVIFEGLSALLIGSLFLLHAIIFIRDVIIPIKIKDFYSEIKKDIDNFLGN